MSRHYKNRLLVTGAILAVSAGIAASGQAQTVDEEIAELRQRVSDLEGGDGNGFRIGPNTMLRVYGYVKADLLFDLDADLGNTIFGLASLTPGFIEDSTFTGHAFQSRLGFDTTTQTSVGELHTKVEGDFFGNGGGSFRLRHAYGELNGLLAGQTWTTFMPIESYPGTLDFQGPAGIPFTRQNQVRYTFDLAGGLSASVAIENDPAGNSTRPAIAAAASYSFGESYVKLAAVSRELEGATTDVSAWGVNLSGNTPLWNGGALQASLTTGEGIGSYMVFGGADLIGDSAIDTDGVTVGFTQDITEKVSFGLVYGLREIDLGAATDTESLETIHVTLNYKPVERVNIGVEYIMGERTLFNGLTADADRVQASVQFNF